LFKQIERFIYKHKVYIFVPETYTPNRSKKPPKLLFAHFILRGLELEMKRSIVKQGAATLMISLPSKWARKFQLKKGDEIDLSEKGKELVVTAQSLFELKMARISLQEVKTFWKRAITALYKAGYDEIEIIFEKQEEISKIYSILNEFVGFEIVSQKEKSCIIKEIVEAKETNFRTIISRTFSMLLSMADDCSNALKQKNTELLGTIPERDLIINKYCNFCRRIINKGLVDLDEAPMLYYVIEALETFGDIYKSFAKHLYDTKKIPDEKVIGMLDKINDLIRFYHSLSNKFEKQKVVDFPEQWEKMKKQIGDLIKTKSASELKTINYIAEMHDLLDHLLGIYLTLNASSLAIL